MFGILIYHWKSQRLKDLNKNIKIIGGPSVPDKSEEFLNKNKFIDIVCHQEGRKKITSILDGLKDNSWIGTPGISFLKKINFITIKDIPRIRDLSLLPSPYLGKYFDKIMELNPNEKWLASWETNREVAHLVVLIVIGVLRLIQKLQKWKWKG